MPTSRGLRRRAPAGRAAAAPLLGGLLAAALLAPLPSAADPSQVGELLARAAAAGAVREMGREELDRLLRYGAAQGLTIFELLHEVILALADRGQSLSLSGDLLREAAVRFDLGGDRVASLLPVSKVSRLSLGADRAQAAGRLDVILAEEHAQFLELADIRLSTRYGFRDVRPGMFGDAYGAGVRRLLFSFNIHRIELYEPNKIAIHVRGFAQPKRWRIPRITPKQTGEAQTQ